MSYIIDKMSSGRNYYKQRSAEENWCNRDRTAPPYHRDLRGRFWHWGRRCCNLGRSSGWFFTDNVRFLRPQPYEPHDSWSKTPVVRITSIRGVGKNLVRDTDPVEWDSCSISPDLIKIYQQKASAFHRNVMGRGLFCVKKKAARKRKRYPPHGKWRTMCKIWRYSNRFGAFLPLIDTWCENIRFISLRFRVRSECT